MTRPSIISDVYYVENVYHVGCNSLMLVVFSTDLV